MKHTTIQMKTHQNTWTGTQTQWQTKNMRHRKESHYNLPYYRHHHHTCEKQNLTQSKRKDMSPAYHISFGPSYYGRAWGASLPL